LIKLASIRITDLFGASVREARFRYWEYRSRFASSNVVDGSMTIVTGADESHAASLLQLLDSVFVHEKNTEVRVYDLGLSKETLVKLRGLESSHRNLKVENFEFGRYPEYFDIRVAAGEYAWKPVIIATELEKVKTKFLLWLDAGDVIVAPLRNVRRAIALSGFWSPESEGTLRDWTDEQLLNRMGLSARQQARRNLNGAIVGIHSGSGIARLLTQLWALGAQSKDWIAPKGSSRKNHRQDQALISCLATVAGLHPFPHKTLELRIHQDLERNNT
jgi:hypothetical protein